MPEKLSMYTQFRIARQCVPGLHDPDSSQYIAQVNHKGKSGSENFTPAIQYFEEAGCPQAFIEMILTKDGEFKDFYEKDIDFSKITPEDLDSILCDCFDGVYSLANGSLDHIYDMGFNKHDQTHINIVAKKTLELLKKAKATRKQKIQGVAAARGHDLGNPFSRVLHSLISPTMFERVVEQIKSDPAQWRLIRRAIQLHNEPVASWFINTEQKGGQLTELQIIRMMRKKFGKAALALIIADKTDIGRHRVSDKPKDADAVHKDPHLEVNLLGKTTELKLSEDEKIFFWNLEFTPGMSKEDADSRFTKNSKRYKHGGAVVSNETHQLHREHHIPHFDRWTSLFWTLYFERIVLTVRSAFALYSKLQSFEISVIDKGLSKKFVFHRKDLRDMFDHIKTAYSIKQ